MTDTVVGKVLIASVKSYPNPSNPGVGIVLFDTSTEEDLDLNALLIERISKDAESYQLRITKAAEAQQLPAVSSPRMQCAPNLMLFDLRVCYMNGGEEERL
jgi:hypothetical protein